MQSVQGTVRFEKGHRIFENHLPGEPLVPGVIIIEALAQIAGLVLISDEGEAVRGYLGEVVRMRFRKTVGPDETILLHAQQLQLFGNVVRFEATAKVNGEVVAEGQIILVQSK